MRKHNCEVPKAQRAGVAAGLSRPK